MAGGDKFGGRAYQDAKQLAIISSGPLGCHDRWGLSLTCGLMNYTIIGAVSALRSIVVFNIEE